MSYNRNSPGALLGLAGIIPNPHISTVANQLQGGLGGNFGARGAGQGPLASPALQAVQSGATQYRPPTAIHQKNIFGQGMGFKPTTAEDRQQYNQSWLSDNRNVGHDQGQVDPGLAAAATGGDEGGGEGGGK